MLYSGVRTVRIRSIYHLLRCYVQVHAPLAHYTLPYGTVRTYVHHTDFDDLVESIYDSSVSRGVVLYGTRKHFEMSLFTRHATQLGLGQFCKVTWSL